MLRVFICGCHSTGKTTLVQEIAKRIEIHVESETARKVIHEMNITNVDFDPRTHPEKFEELQEKIITAQSVMEKRNMDVGRSYISDRGLDPLVYTRLYLGEESAKRLLNLPLTQECINRYQGSVIFVMKPFKECMRQDEVRLTPKMDELLEFTEILEKYLNELNIEYTLIDVLDFEERVRIVLDKINERKMELKMEQESN